MPLECPSCKAADHLRVLATRPEEGRTRRRKICAACGTKFWTEERLSAEAITVRKANGEVVPFSRRSVRENIEKAAVTPIERPRLEQIVDAVLADLFEESGGGVVSSAQVGQAVMARLKAERPETHIRYALSYNGRRDRTGDAQAAWGTARDVRRWLASEYSGLAHRQPYDALRDIVKRSGRRERYVREKLEKSVAVASKGYGDRESVRNFATSVAEAVENELRGQPLVTSGQVAAEVLRVLRGSDDVAYLRYASTAKGFQTAADYDDEAAGLARDRPT